VRQTFACGMIGYNRFDRGLYSNGTLEDVSWPKKIPQRYPLKRKTYRFTECAAAYF
jgi:hypothetical protein